MSPLAWSPLPWHGEGLYKRACTCPGGRIQKEHSWRVTARKHNRSKFNGGRYTRSAYSAVHCLKCDRTWRTKARYVDALPDMSDAEWAQRGVH